MHNTDLKLPRCSALNITDYCSRLSWTQLCSILVQAQHNLLGLSWRSTHAGAVVDAECLQRPGQAQAHQDVKHITAYGVGDGHVSQTWGKESNTVKISIQSADKSVTTGNTLLQHYDSVWLNNNIDVKLLCVFVCVRTLPCDYNTRHAVWDAGACCEEGDAHDDVGNSQSEADHSHLKPKTDWVER